MIALGAVLLGGVFVYSTAQFGFVHGEEFSPYSFKRRSFTYYEIPVFGIQVSPIRHDDTTGDLEGYLTGQKLVAPTQLTQDRWDLVVVNPAFVLGPGVRADATSESFSLMRQLGDGTFAMGMPAMGMGIVDVRDVAEAHLRAGTRPEAHGRNIVVGHDSDLADVAAILREHFGERFAFPRRTLPKWLVWLAGPMTNPLLTRKVVSRNIGLPWKSDNGKAVRELGLTYRPLATTVIEMFQQQAEAGLVPPRGEERAAA